MKKRKRIIAILLAATLAVSGALVAGAAEVDDSQLTDDSQETEKAEETVETVTEDEQSAAEEETAAEEEAAIVDDVGIDEDSAGSDDAAEVETGEFTGMKEIDEIDPNHIGTIEESDSGIQTLAAYKSFSYSYNYTSLSFSSSGGHSGDEILDLAVELIVAHEGGYNTVVPDDNGTGAPSIGKIQWWAEEALTLARLIVAKDNKTAYNLLGDALYNEIIDSSTTWAKGTRVFNTEETKHMQNFLDPDQNPASKEIQDKLARSFVADYVNYGYKLGIRNAAALIYYADIGNQYGYMSVTATSCAQYARNLAGSWSSLTLNELHLASMAYISEKYADRSLIKQYLEVRRGTYGKLVSSGWTYCNSGDYTIPYDEDGHVGAAWLKKALNSYQNAGLTVNNNYDDALKSAVKKYQTSVGLTADGNAGLHTSTKLIHDMYYKSMQQEAKATDIIKINGTWTYTVNGEPDYTYTGLAKNSNGWYYIKNGVLDRSYTGLAKNSNGWWYIASGKLDRSYNGFAKNENGSWYMTNGKLTRKDNTVLKDTKGAIGAKNTWYYVVGSKVQSDFTGLANYKNSSGWWYITKGKVDRSVNTVAKNKNGWYYVVNGKVQRSFSGLANYRNENGWWYITKGKLDRSVNTVAKNKNGWYYVVNGKVQKDFTGLANYKNSSGWWYITNGRVDRTYTGIAQNKNGWYYIKNGKVQKSFSGTVTINGTKYSVTNGKVAK